MSVKLEDKVCRECKKAIRVCAYSPHDLAGEATGIAATRWDGDRGDDYFVGWICLDCAWKEANTVGGKGAISAGGGCGMGDWTFHYH